MVDAAPPRKPSIPIYPLLLVFIALLYCLQPFAGADLFYQLRVGDDILRTHHVPRTDIYSWTHHGQHWIVPEWLSFVSMALAYRITNGFFGTWLLLVLVISGTAVVVYRALRMRDVAAEFAFVLTNLMLVVLRVGISQRPWIFTFFFLAVAVSTIEWARRTAPGCLWRLIPLTAIWTNFHQATSALVAVIVAYAVGDAISAIRSEPSERRRLLVRTGHFILLAVACVVAGMASPYGIGVYRNVMMTVNSVEVMRIPEWLPVTSDPFYFWGYFCLMAVLLVSAVVAKERWDAGSACAVLLMAAAGYLHVRMIPMFAIVATITGGPVLASMLGQKIAEITASPVIRYGALILYIAAVAGIGGRNLIADIPPEHMNANGIGEGAVRTMLFPVNAGAFMRREAFPPNMRILNDYVSGGYLIWAIPKEPVFVDGRTDVYMGDTLHDYDAILSGIHSPAGAAAMQKYDFDCVITGQRDLARAIGTSPGWRLVYHDTMLPGSESYYFIIIRDRPEYRSLIDRCLADRPL